MFTGTIRMKICEATGLRPTDFQKRHNMTFGKPDEQSIDPYVSIDVDENHLGKSLGGRAIFPIYTTLGHECVRVNPPHKQTFTSIHISTNTIKCSWTGSCVYAYATGTDIVARANTCTLYTHPSRTNTKSTFGAEKILCIFPHFALAIFFSRCSSLSAYQCICYFHLPFAQV